MILLLLLAVQDSEKLLREAYNAGAYDTVFGLYSKAMGEALPLEKTREFCKGLRDQYGRWEESGEPETRGTTAVYPAKFERGRLDVLITLDGEGKITALFFRPPQPKIPVPERNAVKMGLPFKGTWFVFWGGDTKEQNYHVVDRAQRRAFDLLMVDESGKTHRGDGARNEDYFAWGQEILAPADGEVVEAIDGIRDMPPGKMNAYLATGNTVILKHAEHEFTLLAHFQRGSVRVKAGAQVKRGDVLGLCGNSGNSSEPHLHFQLMNADFMPEATGVKLFFDRVSVNGEAREDYSPVKGERIAP